MIPSRPMSLIAPATSASQYCRLRPYMITLALLVSMPLHTIASQSSSSDGAKTEVSLWIGNMTETRKAHETAAVRLALEKSRDRYGSYHLSINSNKLSRPRAIRNLSDGKIIQVVTAPELTYRIETDEQPLITIQIPLLQGLLGNRKAIIRRDRAKDFADIQTLEQLKRFNAGLGFDWLDRDYFRSSDLPFTIGADVEQLFNMLAHGRFDYLPLGSTEVTSALAASEHTEQLMVVDNFLIHYPLPVYVYVQVSRSCPDLADRLKLGLERAAKDGSLDNLFNQYYGEFEAVDADVVIIELSNRPSASPPNERQTSP